MKETATTERYDAGRVSLLSCVGDGIRIAVDQRARDVKLTYFAADCEVGYSNQQLVIKGLSAKLDLSGRCTENIEVYGSRRDRAFNDGEVGAAASDIAKTVTTKVYSSGLCAIWTRTPGAGLIEILLTCNLQKKPRLMLTVPPKEVALVRITVDGLQIF